jgi:sugar phosphate isomerase/epimerase
MSIAAQSITRALAMFAEGPDAGDSPDLHGIAGIAPYVYIEMEWSRTAPRLGLNVPYEWWPAAPVLKEIEAAGFDWVQVPSPPATVLSDPRQLSRHAIALAAALETSGLRVVVHAPGGLRAGSLDGDRAFQGLLAYGAELGAECVVYHAADFADRPASEDSLLAETRALARLARDAERHRLMIALENLAPVFPAPDRLSFKPMLIRTMANRIGSPSVGLCLDIGHAHVVADLRRADPRELIEPALDHAVIFHLHDNLGARRGDPAPPELDPLRLDLHLPPGRGSVPWGVLGPLLDRRPEPLVLEVHPPHRPSPAALHVEARAALAPAPQRTAA